MLPRLPGAWLLALVAILSVTAFLPAKPPDLPDDPPVEVKPAQSIPSLPPTAWLEADDRRIAFPPTSLVPTQEILAGLIGEAAEEASEAEQPTPSVCCPPPSTPACPYRQMSKAQPRARAAAALVPCNDVLANLEALNRAAVALEQARKLASQGQICEALAQLEVVRCLAPGSSYQARIDEVIAELGTDSSGNTERVSTPTTYPGCEEGCCGFFWMGDLGQVGACWMGQVLGHCEKLKAAPECLSCCGKCQKTPCCPSSCCQDACASDKCCKDACGNVKDVKKVCGSAKGCKDACGSGKCCTEVCGSSRCCPTECRDKGCKGDAQIGAKLQKPVTLACEATPLGMVLEHIRCVSDIDVCVCGRLSMWQPVTIHVENAPVCVALDLVSRTLGADTIVEGNVVCLKGTRCSAEEGCSNDGKGADASPSSSRKRHGAKKKRREGSACKKADRMHTRHVRKMERKARRDRREAGVEEQVNGLMKACYLAIEEERYEKAADLAREARALDPVRVEGDPLVYKLDLLADKATPTQGCPPCSPPSDNGCTEQPEDGGLSLRPALPAIDPAVVRALDGLLNGSDVLGRSCGAAQPGVVQAAGTVENQKVERVGQIILIGNECTRDEVILRQVPLAPGQVLTQPALQQAERNLVRLNVFETTPDGSVRPTVTVLENPLDPQSSYKDVLVSVQEKPTGTLMLGVGVNSEAGLAGSLVLNERNFDLFKVPTSLDDLLNGRAFRGAGQELSLGMSLTGGVVAQLSKLPFAGANWTVLVRNGIVAVWMSPESTKTR